MADTAESSTHDTAQAAAQPAQQPEASHGETQEYDQVRYRDPRFNVKINQHSIVPIAGRPTDAHKIQYPWLKLFCEKEESVTGQTYYFTNQTTGESKYEEPDEPFWLWDYENGKIHASGLQQPTPKEKLSEENDALQEEKATLHYDENETKDPAMGWQGYQPRVHGSWDATKPYAAYHSYLNWKKTQPANAQAAAAAQQAYGATGAFNARTGRFQTDDQTAERHDAHNKAGRQMNAYFDVDEAANAHEGRSLKEERRNAKYSKKEIKEMNEKRKAKKMEKRKAFLMS